MRNRIPSHAHSLFIPSLPLCQTKFYVNNLKPGTKHRFRITVATMMNGWTENPSAQREISQLALPRWLTALLTTCSLTHSLTLPFQAWNLVGRSNPYYFSCKTRYKGCVAGELVLVPVILRWIIQVNQTLSSSHTCQSLNPKTKFFKKKSIVPTISNPTLQPLQTMDWATYG